MYFSTILYVCSAATLAVAQASTDAPVVNGNPTGATFSATLSSKPAGSNGLSGTITGTSAANGTGVLWAVSLSGLPTTGGPFMYHIHEKPVPENGNCTATGAHQDPYKRGEVPPCDPAQKQTCQTGDLSGKWGNITGTSFSASYLDLWTSTKPSDPAYFGNLSVVVHLANKTRIACANFLVLGDNPTPTEPPSSNTSVPHPTGTGGSTHNGAQPSGTGSPIAPSPPSFTGAAATLGMSLTGGAVLAGLVALVL